MTRKLFAWALALLAAFMPIAACAADDHQEMIGGILAYLSDGQDLQAWIDSSLCDAAGSGTDSLLPALLRMDKGFDFSKYAVALESKLDEGIKSATTRQRTGLMLALLDESKRPEAHFADETIGELGVMSYVFGLHLLNNGFESELWNTSGILDKLNELQLSDGGWAVTGQYGDPDVTAMCLQALACLRDDALAAEMIERALIYLSNAQNQDGGYASYGKPACESCAQVIIALNSLGIDPLTDERFIKNGKTALDAMLGFRQDNGSFSHIHDSKPNTMACVQALCAFVALEHPGLVFYDFDDLQSANAMSSGLDLPVWKLAAFACIGLFAIAGFIIALIRRRAFGKRMALIVIVCLMAGYAVWTINIESAGSYYSAEESDKPVAGQVWVSIDCRSVAGLADDGSTPESGIILDRTQIDFYDGDSAFDVLTHAVRRFGIHLEHEGSGDLSYVNGVNHLYEYAYGDLSGWVYFVNGEEMSIGCGSYIVQNGDDIAWKYTTKLGEDLR